MRILVESLRRLYQLQNEKVTLEKLTNMLNNNELTQEEFNYITLR